VTISSFALPLVCALYNRRYNAASVLAKTSPKRTVLLLHISGTILIPLRARLREKGLIIA
jgi:hypothetical protein